jgi:hypothetical protein
MSTRTSLMALLPLALAACSLAPLQQDGPVKLGPGQGLAAITFDSLDPLIDVVLDGKRTGTRLKIESVPVGRTIYLVQAPDDFYCMTTFRYGQWAFKAKDGADLACFPVIAGALSYSGTLAPRVEGKTIVNHQVQDPQGFRVLLQQQYPQVAQEFPAPPTAP